MKEAGPDVAPAVTVKVQLLPVWVTEESLASIRVASPQVMS